MANIQLFAQKQEAGSFSDAPAPAINYTQLDLMESEPIKLTLSIQDFEDPTKVASSFSKSFKLPHTAVNGQFFKAAFNVNSTDFDISQKANAYILNNGTFFASGNIRLTGITVSPADGNVQYEITFFGETSDFASKVGGGFLNELDLSNLTHTKSYKNVTDSWEELLEDGDIVYGLIEWGYNYNDDNQPSNTTLTKGFLKSFDEIAYPVYLEQFKPQIRAKVIWDKIFEDAGYTYESDFLDSTRFTKLYVITETESRATLPTEAQFRATGTMPAFRNGVVVQTTDNEYLAECGNEIYDYLNAYDNVAYEYTAQTTAYHTFVVKCNFFLQKMDSSSPPPTGNVYNYTITLYNSRIGGDSWSHTWTNQPASFNTGEITVLNGTYPLYLQAGDKITMYVSAECANGPFRANFNQLVFSCTKAGTDFNVASMLPTTIKKLDFVRSIINKFKLVFVPSKDKINHFEIEPWVDWIRSGSKVDWTDKLDKSKDISIRPLFDNQKRKMVFTEKEDTDFLNDEYQKSNDKKPFGQLILDSTIDLITGEETVSTEFAPCPIAPIAYTSTYAGTGAKFLIPHIAKDTGGSAGESSAGAQGKREPITPKMRLVYYNGIQSSYNTWYMATEVNGGTPISKTTHPLFSNFSAWPVDESSTFDLNWKNQEPLWDTSLTGLEKWYTPFTAFTVYWKDWYDMVYDPYSRMIEATFVLSYVDLLNFNFNDIVFIRDAWYFVNEIKDYTLGETSSCRVSLVKIGNDLELGLIVPSPFTKINLCFSSTSACDAYCCCQYTTRCSTYDTYYMDGETFSESMYIFTDLYGSTFATPGYYSDGTNACLVGEGGVIQAFYSTAGCNCGGLPDYSFSVNYATYPCATLGDLAPVTVHAELSTFTDNTYIYLDAAHTILAPAGYYRETTDIDYSLKVKSTGKVLSTQELSECESVSKYIYYPKFATVECDACCSIDYRTIYTDSPDFSSSTELYYPYADPSQTPLGFYAVGDDIMEVDASGNIVDFSLCSSCSPCPDGTVSVNVCVFQDLDGYKTNGVIYTSTDGVTWDYKGVVTVTTTNPSMAPTCQEFLIDAGLYCKVVFGTNEPDGTLTATLEEDGEVTLVDDTTTPGSYTLTFPTILVDGIDYYATGSVSGGSVVTPTYYAQSLWFESNLDNPCRPYCHTDLVASTYYGDNLTLATSTYLYTDNAGTTPASPGWYSDGVVISQVGANGLLIAGANPESCDCDITEKKLYEYKTTYHASVTCSACDGTIGAPTTIYGTEPAVADCKVFYQYGPSGLEFATVGYYAVNNYWAEVGTDGVVVSSGRCEDDCTITPYYATYYIINRTSGTVDYRYTGQDDVLYTGTIPTGKYILTECMDLLTLYVSGYCEIKEVFSCMS